MNSQRKREFSAIFLGIVIGGGGIRFAYENGILHITKKNINSPISQPTHLPKKPTPFQALMADNSTGQPAKSPSIKREWDIKLADKNVWGQALHFTLVNI